MGATKTNEDRRMSETKFTPGPWILIEGRFGSEIEITTESRQENSKGKICEMDIYYDGSHGIEQPANMHLIKTSPKMYEMLERIDLELIPMAGEAAKQDAFRWEIKELLAEARGGK